MSKRDIGQEILDGIREIKAHKTGKKPLKTNTLSEPSSPQVIREKLKLSQSAFASLMGVSTRTIQDWEQGRRKPQGPATEPCPRQAAAAKRSVTNPGSPPAAGEPLPPIQNSYLMGTSSPRSFPSVPRSLP